jgi:prephenate dehydrogenase
MFIRRLCIIGVGLIGGSLARALRQAGVCGEIVGCGRNADNLRQAVDLGVIDRYTSDIARAVAGADCIVVAVPLGTMDQAFQAMRGHLAEDALITDVGSAKAGVIEAARRHLGQHLPRFVAAHPLAGGEKTGVAASVPDLFQNRRVILTPTADTDPAALAAIREMWQIAGAEVLDMPPGQHDEILAATSHLPHLLAFTLVNQLQDMEQQQPTFRFAASGFRDFSRIASSDPVMWRDICLSNREAVLEAITRFKARLSELEQAIAEGQAGEIEDNFCRAKQARDGFYA